ncbi:unnamed protein product [Caenorhabditis bovis]|uniref:Uncharacterized protein n=1 Tax=Caenorhabditis bovis TaxID=2654633 RepID=A0A8S1ERK8_9PELO|nr:unnamed protein product [Caenorhabditis bovis]
MSSRPFSVTLSEDDLRPHMRKPKSSGISSDIQILDLTQKYEERDAKKSEIRKKLIEEERIKEENRKKGEMRRELEEMWKEASAVDRIRTPIDGKSNDGMRNNSNDVKPKVN